MVCSIGPVLTLTLLEMNPVIISTMGSPVNKLGPSHRTYPWEVAEEII